ncbi:subtilisin-like protease [Typha angustifolia]|uniref:subtilisin-like protease n=1 Tax=Typha angustifolia TaxID=59011 RepID=UPI003C2F13B0
MRRSCILTSFTSGNRRTQPLPTVPTSRVSTHPPYLRAAEGNICTYVEVLTGFPVKLTGDEVMWMKKKEGFLTAYEDRLLPLLTTHTPAFLGLQPGDGFPGGPGMGKGVIICNSYKFTRVAKNSTGKGAVQRRLQHGTHTTSTDAGKFVKDANVLGIGNCTAASLGCYKSDIHAGMDAAVQDVVDVMSLSLGSVFKIPFYPGVIAIGAFRAMEKGIFVSCAAGNSGPGDGTLRNETPWVLSVDVSAMDRKIRATVKLGNREELDGESAFQPADFKSTMLPFVHPEKAVSANCDSSTN